MFRVDSQQKLAHDILHEEYMTGLYDTLPIQYKLFPHEQAFDDSGEEKPLYNKKQQWLIVTKLSQP